MEVVIVIGVIIFLIWIFSGSNTSSSSTSYKPPPTPFAYDLERQAQEKLRAEEERKRKEEAAKQQAERIRIEQEAQRQKALKSQQEAARLKEQRRAQEQARLNAKVAFFKSNWTSFQSIIQQNNITGLYHFTDRANLPSIRQHGGLLSWYYCKQNNITISKPGGSATSWILDERKGLQDFVRVSFVRDHPMMFVAQNDGRLANPVILEINPEVIYLKSTKYACQNAAKNGITADATLEKFNSIRFPLLRSRYFDLSTEDKPFYQAEILVLQKIPLEYITNINCI
jgi:hypothetical protein